jgi:hypothetical protein
MRYLALLLSVTIFTGCGAKTVIKTVRVTETQTTTVMKRIAAPPEAVFVLDRGGDLVYKPDHGELEGSGSLSRTARLQLDGPGRPRIQGPVRCGLGRSPRDARSVLMRA